MEDAIHYSHWSLWIASIFQEFMNEVFWEFLHSFVIEYIDDVLIYSQNLADHRHHYMQVLQRLRLYHLCEFHRATVQFLGYIIGQEGIQMYQGKVTAITEWPIPQSVKELQRFLGFAHFYRRFIKDFSLHTLMSMLWGKPKSLSWNTNAHEAFKKLKTAFSTAPNPSPSRPQCPICGGRGRLHRRSYAVLAIRWASTAPALRILL